MIGISAATYAANGSIVLRDKGRQQVSGDESRAVRSRTLDTGTAIVNLGTDHGDKTIVVYVVVDESTFSIIDNIHRNQTRVIISTRTGVFKGIIKSKSLDGTTLRITLWVESRIDE